MTPVCDLNAARAARAWFQRIREAGWRGHQIGPTPAGTLGGPTLYLCAVEHRVHVIVQFVQDALAHLAEFGSGQGLSFDDACTGLGTALQEVGKAWPNCPPELHSALELFAGLYLPGTQSYRMAQQFGTDGQFLILQYPHVATGHGLLRPVALTGSQICSPAEIEAAVQSVLAIDRQNHPERFPRAPLLPFRLKSRDTPVPKPPRGPKSAPRTPSPEGADDDANPPPDLPAPLRERLQSVRASAERNLQAARIDETTWSHWQQRIHATVESPDRPWVRLRALYAIADEVLNRVRGQVACRNGCSHCCHIRVDLAPTEADLLGHSIGRRPEAPSAAQLQTFEPGYHRPCPFLKDNTCTVYDHRPLACRVHVNFDADALLCELTQWASEIRELPGLALKETFDRAYAHICGLRNADIREYFPSHHGHPETEEARPLAKPCRVPVGDEGPLVGS